MKLFADGRTVVITGGGRGIGDTSDGMLVGGEDFAEDGALTVVEGGAGEGEGPERKVSNASSKSQALEREELQ